MRKLLLLLLCFSLILCSFVACDKIDGDGGETEANSGNSSTTESATTSSTTTTATTTATDAPTETVTFSAGYARENISPTQFPCGMDGNTNASRVNDDLYATAVAFSDGKTKTVVITLDVVYISNSMYDAIIKDIVAKTGLPKENIYIHSTHNHSSPNYVLAEQSTDTAAKKWRTDVIAKVPVAAKNALDDLKNAEIYTGSSYTSGLNMVRRSGYHQATDTQLQVIRFVREGAKDIVLANWQAHPASSVNSGAITADYIGEFRRLVEQKNDVYFAYFNGANGNLNVNIRGNYATSLEGVKSVGVSLADKLNTILASSNIMKKVNSGSVEVRETVCAVDIAPVDSAMKSKVLELYSQGNVNNSSAQSIGLESVYVLRALKSRIDLTANGASTQDIKLWALSFGDVAFVFAPYEMFDDNGVQIKKDSPFKTTFICTVSGGGNNGYIPSEGEFGKNIYEVSVCLYSKGTGEKLADSFVNTLKEMKN